MAGPDPEQNYQRLVSGEVASVRAVADSLDTVESGVGAAETVVSAARDALTGCRGTAAAGFAARVDRTGAAAGIVRHRLAELADLVRAGLAACRTAQWAADEYVQVWRHRPADAEPSELDLLAAEVCRALDRVRAGYDDTLRRHTARLGALEPGFAALLGQQTGWARTDLLGDENFAAGPLVAHPPLSGDPLATWIPCGLAYRARADQLLVTYHDATDKSDGLLSIIDNGSGAEVKNLELGGPDTSLFGLTLPTEGPAHSCGAAVSADELLVTSTVDGKSQVHRYAMADFDAASSGDRVAARDVVEVRASSYATCADGALWLGDTAANALYGYRLVRGTPVGEPIARYTTPPHARGVQVRADELIYSSSVGHAESALIVVPRGDYDRNAAVTELAAPAAAGDVTLVGDELYTVYPPVVRTRLTKTPLATLVGADGQVIDPDLVRDAAARLAAGADRLAACADTLSEPRLAGALGDSAAAGEFAEAVADALTVHGQDLVRGSRWLRHLAARACELTQLTPRPTGGARLGG